MQKDQAETPKLKRLRRVQKSSTPEPVKKNTVDHITNVRAGSSHHRATMAPSDFASQQSKNFTLTSCYVEVLQS